MVSEVSIVALLRGINLISHCTFKAVQQTDISFRELMLSEGNSGKSLVILAACLAFNCNDISMSPH